MVSSKFLSDMCTLIWYISLYHVPTRKITAWLSHLENFLSFLWWHSRSLRGVGGGGAAPSLPPNCPHSPFTVCIFVFLLPPLACLLTFTPTSLVTLPKKGLIQGKNVNFKSINWDIIYSSGKNICWQRK